MTRHALLFHNGKAMDSIRIIGFDFMSYLPMTSFLTNKCEKTISCLNANALVGRPWKEIQKVIDKVHKHVFGHASFTDFRILLERNGIWNESIQDYVKNIIDSCRYCKHSAPPEPPRKVSISSLSKQINDVLCIDHFYLDDMCLIHFMDLTTRFSMDLIVQSTATSEVIMALETTWIPSFSYPDRIRGDSAFTRNEFKEYLSEIGSSFDLVPPDRQK